MVSTRLPIAALLMLGVAGCALLIDLGDEPQLLPPAEAGAETSTSTTGPICGLPPSTNAKCAACINASCCDVSKECAANPRCIEGLECIKDCLVQQACVLQCFQDFPEVRTTASCSAFSCSECSPGPECAKLGKCVFDLARDDFRRGVEEGRILEIDETKCKLARQQVVSEGVADAGVCFDP